MDNFNNEIHDLGNAYFFDNEYQIALDYYKEIKNYDKQYIIDSNISACYLYMNDYLTALEYGLKSVQNNLQYSTGWGRIGSAYKGLNMKKESIRAFKIAHNLNPNNKEYLRYISEENEQEIVLDKNKMFDIFLNDNELMNKLRDKDFRNSILNIRNPQDIFKNNDLINLISNMIVQMKK
jgi:stress-induced-phosphoprotein 1